MDSPAQRLSSGRRNNAVYVPGVLAHQEKGLLSTSLVVIRTPAFSMLVTYSRTMPFNQ